MINGKTEKTQSLSYFDSVEIQQKKYFRSNFLKFMQSQCGSISGPRSIQLENGISIQSLWLHQPSRSAIEQLLEIDCRISRVHVALDILSRTKSKAKELQEYLSQTFVLSSTPYDPVTWFRTDDNSSGDSTCYFGFSKPRGPGKTAALYADKVGKVTNTPCCHLEARLELIKTLQRSSVNNVQNLLNFNHKEFWKQRIMLLQPPTELDIGKAWCKAFTKSSYSKKFPYGTRTNSIQRVGALLLRTAQDRHGNVNANDLLYFLQNTPVLGKQSPKGCFKALDSSWIVLHSENGLWENPIQINDLKI